MGREFILAGNSHLFAMGAPRDYQGGLSLMPITVDRCRGYILMEAYGQGRTDSYWRGLVGHARDRAIILIYAGNQHFSDFLLAPEPFVDFVDGEKGAGLHPGATIVPRRLIEEHFRQSHGHLRALLDALREAGAAQAALLGTPPPRGDYATALADFRSNPAYQDFARQRGLDIAHVSPTPQRIMLKLWRLVQGVMSEVAAQHGALFVPVFDRAFGPDGFLAERFRGSMQDFTHANEAYGRLMLSHALGLASAEVGLGASL